jgi:hypothetical protein
MQGSARYLPAGLQRGRGSKGIRERAKLNSAEMSDAGTRSRLRAQCRRSSKGSRERQRQLLVRRCTQRQLTRARYEEHRDEDRAMHQHGTEPEKAPPPRTQPMLSPGAPQHEPGDRRHQTERR